jgi:L-seryl-tRNA(Ser) seleniumtransferase
VPEQPSREALRSLPSVERLAEAIGPELSHGVAVAAARAEIDEARARIRAGEPPPGAEEMRERAARRAAALSAPGPRRVINATGVVLHTNLGRAPLAPAAAAAAARIAEGYSDLEFDLEKGSRGRRDAHLAPLLADLSGAEDALAVNNNAAAVLLALTATAAGGEVVVGRGQLIEIGGSFRIPEILAQSGARLVEVGTTNRTRIGDYAEAIGPQTRALLRVHQSNFRTVGFAEEASLEEICRLGAERGVPVIDDLGSGAIEPIGDEPPLRRSVAAGCDLVCCSADKLLGGPQAGIICGRAEAVSRCRSHPLARALRLDKMQIAALAETLRLHRDEGPGAVPALAMLARSEEQLRSRAAAMADRIGPAAEVMDGTAPPGGGSLPGTELPGPVCSVDATPLGADPLAAALRQAEPPVIARIAGGRVVLDPRTMDDEEAAQAAAAVSAALGR